jgi:hypothetical protein
MESSDVYSFCKAIESRLPSSECRLETFTVTSNEEVVVSEYDPKSDKIVKRWKTVPSDSEIWDLVMKNVNVNHRAFIVGNWAYVVHSEAVDSFSPDEILDDRYMFPLNCVEEFVTALNMNALFDEILVELQKMQPHLKRAAEPTLALELLYDPKPDAVVRYSGGIPDDVKARYFNNICAWVQCVRYGCYRIGIKGCSGKSFYVENGWLYFSDSESFDANNKSTYASKEPYVHDAKWMMDKLKAASRKWLSAKPTNEKPRYSSAAGNPVKKGNFQRPAVTSTPTATKAMSGESTWRSKDVCPTGPDDDGFTPVPKRR